MRIEDIDKNFKIETKIEREGLVFQNVLNTAPFKVHGLMHVDGQYRRLPKEIADGTNQGVATLHAHTAGGRLRFKTNSPFIAIKAVMPNYYNGVHFPLTGSSGFDLYVDNSYFRTFVPPFDLKANKGYESVHDLDGQMHEVLIHFPLYSEVSELYIGLKDGCEVLEADPYKTELPVVYYGSSITQGGCASRPGMAYQNILSRHLSCEQLNLGFSGSARGEQIMADYIAGLEMSAYVHDYDHNAPTNEHLLATHEKFFLTVREKHPDLPVIFATRPHVADDTFGNYSGQRAAIIEKTYNNALNRGDKNVYFLDNAALTRLCGNEGNVDNTHPTDFGFMSMALAFEEVMKNIL